MSVEAEKPINLSETNRVRIKESLAAMRTARVQQEAVEISQSLGGNPQLEHLVAKSRSRLRKTLEEMRRG